MVFVIHGGPLEAKSALLATSLSEYYRPGKIICRVMKPESQWGAISAETRELFQQLHIDLSDNRNEVDLSYPHGNKINAFAGIDEPALFLDSDMLLMRPFSWHYTLSGDVAVKPADLDTFTNGGGSWASVWQHFNLPTPPKNCIATISGAQMRPYYNAGFIAVKNGDQFSEMWLDTALQIDRNQDVINKRPWLDQIALPVTIARLGWKTSLLSEELNYPSHFTETTRLAPYFSHYHWPKKILESKVLLFATHRLLKKYPLLTKVLSKYEEWDDVISSGFFSTSLS
jgi:hypothetical protein